MVFFLLQIPADKTQKPWHTAFIKHHLWSTATKYLFNNLMWDTNKIRAQYYFNC